MAKQTKSQRIRTLLAQGKTVKEIVKTVKCNPALVYQVKSYDKTKAKKVAAKKPTAKKDWVMVGIGASNKPVGIPRNVYEELHKPGTIQPLDYPTPKRNIVQRFFNWLCGG